MVWHQRLLTTNLPSLFSPVDNKLKGPIIPELSRISTLQSIALYNAKEINLHKNQLSGRIPPELGSMPHLNNLELQFNEHLSGTIPVELFNAGNLNLLNLGGTDLSGTIDTRIGNLTKLATLGLFKTGEHKSQVPPSQHI